MREVEGTTWIFQLVIVFILIFACFFAVAELVELQECIYLGIKQKNGILNMDFH